MNTEEMRFDGPDYVPARDQVRLSSQYLRVYNLMTDHKWRSLSEIEEAAGGTIASVSARLRDMRKPRFGSHTIEKKYVENGLWLYRMVS